MRAKILTLLCSLLVISCSKETTTVAAPGPEDLPAGNWIVDYDASTIGFQGTQNGNTFDGFFEKTQVSIQFDEDNLENSAIEVVIDMSSAVTGDRQKDTALPRADWFDTKRHPFANFVSTVISKSDDGNYLARGILTIRDVAHPIDLPFTLTIEDGNAAANGATTLVRTSFGVGQGEFSTDEWVGLMVKVLIHIEASAR